MAKDKPTSSKQKVSRNASKKAAIQVMKGLPKGSLSTMGGLLGSLLGPKGSMLGGMAGAGISRITGMGDYEVKSNTIATQGGSLGGEVPHFGKEDNSTRVRHREFVKDIVVPSNPTTFVNQSFVINPSNVALFPWLARFAENYQQYRVHGMVLYFKTTTSDYSASGALGKIAMATNYNVRDSDYANMVELENAEFSVSGKPSLSRVHPIECAPNNGVPLVRYVRDTQYDATGGDERLYDVGKFQFATQGLPGTVGTTLGELWVSYDIEFYKPIVGRGASGGVQYVPVSIPVFDTLGGEGSESLFQIERSILPVNPAWSLDDMWQNMLSPGVYVRAAPLDVQSARISRSVYRPEPDSLDPDGQFPAYWADPQNLVLQRKGVYTIKLMLRPKTTGPARGTSSYCSYAVNNDSLAPLSATLFNRAPRILVTHSNTLATQFSILNGSAVTGFTPVTPPTNSYTSTGVVGTRVSGTGCEWYLSIWVYDDHPSGDGVNVQFFGDTPGDAATYTSGGLKYSYYGEQRLSVATQQNLEFTIGYSNVNLQTYYKPAVDKLTSDDETTLKTSIDGVVALLPKLRSLGLLV